MTGSDSGAAETAIHYDGTNLDQIKELAGTLREGIPRFLPASTYNHDRIWSRDAGTWIDLWPGCWVVRGTDGALNIVGHYDPATYQPELDRQRAAAAQRNRALLRALWPADGPQ